MAQEQSFSQLWCFVICKLSLKKDTDVLRLRKLEVEKRLSLNSEDERRNEIVDMPRATTIVGVYKGF
jgi:hypothetical protein